MKFKHFRLQNANTDASGGGAPEVVDRGDTLEPLVIEAVDPEVVLAADPEVKKLAAEIEADLETKGDETADDKRKDSRIPLNRHEAILNKEREKSAALAAENEQLKRRGQVTDNVTAANADFATMEASVVALEEQYANLLTDGEVKKATAVMAEIRKTERQMAETKADLKVQAATVQIAEATRYSTALGRIEAAYPALDPDHESYEEGTMTRVAKMARMNQADGMTRTAALQDAVETVLGAATARQEAATTVTPRVPAKDIGAERKTAAVDKAGEAISKTPPSLSRTGLDSDKMGGGTESAAAVMAMSQKEFAALSDSALSKLRGDTL
jgi:hypothetical protein